MYHKSKHVASIFRHKPLTNWVVLLPFRHKQPLLEKETTMGDNAPEHNPFADQTLASWTTACTDDLTTDDNSSDEDDQVDNDDSSAPAA